MSEEAILDPDEMGYAFLLLLMTLPDDTKRATIAKLERFINVPSQVFFATTPDPVRTRGAAVKLANILRVGLAPDSPVDSGKQPPT